MEDQKPERRVFPRVAVSVAAMIKGKDDIVVGLVENISLGGLYVRMQHGISIAPGEMVRVDIYLNESGQSRSVLNTSGRTVWVNEKGIGVQFQALASTDRTWLEAIINFLSAEERGSDDRRFLQFQLSLSSL